MKCFFFKRINCPYCNEARFYLEGSKEKYITCVRCGNPLKKANYVDLKYIEKGKKYEACN